MPIAIHTKFLGPTDTRGARVKASVRRPDGSIESVTTPYSYEGDEHAKAADVLRQRYWPDMPMYLAGQTLDGRGNVFTVTPQEV